MKDLVDQPEDFAQQRVEGKAVVTEETFATAVADLAEGIGEGGLTGEVEIRGVVDEEDNGGATAFEPVEDGGRSDGSEEVCHE